MSVSIAPAIESQSSLFRREIKLFPLREVVVRLLEWLLKSYLKKLNGKLDVAYTEIQGALVVIQEYSETEAQRDLPAVKAMIKLLIRFKERLAEVNYFDNKGVEIKINLVISSLYDTEIQLKKKTFEGQPRTSAQAEMLEALASNSRGAIQSTLSH